MLNLSHKKPEAYKSAQLLCKEIYNLTNLLPLEEKFNLISQLKRASVSVCSNIAEGCARKSLLERKRYFEISRVSVVEIDTQIELALMLNFIHPNQILNVKAPILSNY
jgi:four helix bundle protein